MLENNVIRRKGFCETKTIHVYICVYLLCAQCTVQSVLVIFIGMVNFSTFSYLSLHVFLKVMLIFTNSVFSFN